MGSVLRKLGFSQGSLYQLEAHRKKFTEMRFKGGFDGSEARRQRKCRCHVFKQQRQQHQLCCGQRVFHIQDMLSLDEPCMAFIWCIFRLKHNISLYQFHTAVINTILNTFLTHGCLETDLLPAKSSQFSCLLQSCINLVPASLNVCLKVSISC